MKVANAPCSWGVLEFDLEGQSAGYAQVLDEIAQSGYAGTELGDFGFMPTDPIVLRQELGRRNLSMLAAFVPIDLSNPAAHADSVEQALRMATLLSQVSDNPFIVLSDENGKNETRRKLAGRIEKVNQLTDQQWKTFTTQAEFIAAAVFDKTEVKTVFHHHCGGFVETPEEIERFLQGTDPLLLGLCLDTGHYTFGGGNASKALDKFADRIWHVHFKDCQPEIAQKSRTQGWDYFESVKNGVFCELGQGEVDFGALVALLKKQDYTGWIVVEQDVLPGMGSPLESAIRNRKYLQKLGL